MKMTKDKYEGVGYRDNEGEDDMGGKGEVIVRLRVRVMISIRVGLLAKAKKSEGKGDDEYKGEGRVYARAMLGIGWAIGMDDGDD